ncbi:MAG: endonuclease III domain-containing protein [Candidatus Omnitrophota bacterium]|nr:endonuclease III domain-containing protein [Candidatus Omnitrophota bacterium]
MISRNKSILKEIYRRLNIAFGPQHWWPADTQFEVIAGAILTQNTAWSNVKKAIDNLKSQKLLKPLALKNVNIKKLARLIRPSGYYNQKAKKLKNFISFLFERYQGKLSKMFKQETSKLREELLEVNGIGPETADSILLYAGERKVFVVDAYTKRILSRHKIIDASLDYAQVQKLFMKNLLHDAKLFNEYHALLVKLGKDICKTKPNCSYCPLENL